MFAISSKLAITPQINRDVVHSSSYGRIIYDTKFDDFDEEQVYNAGDKIVKDGLIYIAIEDTQGV